MARFGPQNNHNVLKLTSASILCFVAAVRLTQAAAPSVLPKISTGSSPDTTKINPAKEHWHPREATTGTGSQVTSEESKKFQSRMMQAEANQQPQQTGAQLAINHDSYYSDSWHPHSLVPTFTDQEQGDEMVALASDVSEMQSMIDTNRSLVVPPEAIVQNQQQEINKHSETESDKVGTLNEAERNQNAKARPVSDEYYADDDEEEDDSNIGKLDFENERKEQRTSQPQQTNYQGYFSNLSSGKINQNSRDLKQIIASGNGQRVPLSQSLLQPNKTSKLSDSVSEGGWLPSSKSQAGFKSFNLGQMNKGHESHLPHLHSNEPIKGNYETAQKQQEKPSQRPIAKDESRLASLFGIRGSSFSSSMKTDAAIEYLRNMLKDRHSKTLHQVNSSLTELPVKQPVAGKEQLNLDDTVDRQQDEQTANLNRLSIIAARFNQMRNISSLQEDRRQNKPITADETKTMLIGADDGDSSKTISNLPVMLQQESAYNLMEAKRVPLQTVPLKEISKPQPTAVVNPGKIYRHESQAASVNAPVHHPNPQVVPVITEDVRQRHVLKPQKQPKIVSYNYFESPPEQSDQSSLIATNYQLGDALYTSNGGLEHVLSTHEVEAIQGQLSNIDHPVVPIVDTKPQLHPHHSPLSNHQRDQSLARILAGLSSGQLQPDSPHKDSSAGKHYSEDIMRDIESNQGPVSVSPPPMFTREKMSTPRPRNPESGKGHRVETNTRANPENIDEDDKKKNLIVYLNHPRPEDMSKPEEAYKIDQSSKSSRQNSFVSAKEFDTNGLSKETRHLDISSLSELDALKDSTDKEGLSVVVIGDAYKYKKIVLLISSKSGGLKFIPMVKDMKK